MLGHIEMEYAPPIMGKYEENEQNFERPRWHDEEVDSDKFFQL